MTDSDVMRPASPEELARDLGLDTTARDHPAGVRLAWEPLLDALRWKPSQDMHVETHRASSPGAIVTLAWSCMDLSREQGEVTVRVNVCGSGSGGARAELVDLPFRTDMGVIPLRLRPMPLGEASVGVPDGPRPWVAWVHRNVAVEIVDRGADAPVAEMARRIQDAMARAPEGYPAELAALPEPMPTQRAGRVGEQIAVTTTAVDGIDVHIDYSKRGPWEYPAALSLVARRPGRHEAVVVATHRATLLSRLWRFPIDISG